jgi:hypothetical protein
MAILLVVLSLICINMGSETVQVTRVLNESKIEEKISSGKKVPKKKL